MPDTRPVYCLLWGVQPEGGGDPTLENIRLPWRPDELDSWRDPWENYRESHSGVDIIETEDHLVEFLDESDSDEIDWALVVFDVTGPTAIRQRSSYYRPPLDERDYMRGERHA